MGVAVGSPSFKLDAGIFQRDEAAAAAKEPVASRGIAPLIDVEAPYVAELVLQEVERRFGKAAVNAGYKVFTTIDGRLQAAANRAMRLSLLEYDRRHDCRGTIETLELPASALEAVGTVLKGSATEYADIQLQLFSDCAEAVYVHLMDHRY